MKRISQTLKVVLALFVAVFSNGLLPTTVAYATPPGNNGTLKIHEQGTPSGTESNNPKVCSFNVEGFGFDSGQTGYIMFDVQGGDGPTGTAAGPYSFGPTNGSGYYATQYFDLDPGHYKATLYGKMLPGGQLDDEKAKSKVFKVDCAPDEVTVATVIVNDPCGKRNDSFTVPVTNHVTYKYKIGNGPWHSVTEGVAIPAAFWGSTYTVTASAEAGYVLTGDATQTFKFTNESCDVVIPTPEPEMKDPCGPHNAYWDVTDTDTVDWSINKDGHLIATAKPGYIFEGQKTTIDFGKAVDSNVPCIVEIPKPETPKVYDPCGLHNAHWIIPKDTMQIDWSLNQKDELIATAKPGYIFEGEQHSINFGKAVDSGKLCPAKPEAPKFIDYCGERTDYVVIPWVKGVTYKIDGVKASAGYHAVSGTVTVTAVAADEDYVLVGYEKGPWTHEFTDTECVTITKSSQPVTDTNGDGGIGVGDIVTWNITVTNNSDNDLDNFRIELNDSSATIVDNEYVTDGVIKYLKHGTSVNVTATSKLTVDDVKACKATNIVEFQGWYTRKHHDIDKYGHENSTNFSLKYGNHDSDEEDEFDFSGTSNTATAEFTCPTPGSGSGGETPTETPSGETPVVLPSTGPADSGSPLMAIIAAVVAYGATYFMQRRRELVSNN